MPSTYSRPSAASQSQPRGSRRRDREEEEEEEDAEFDEETVQETGGLSEIVGFPPLLGLCLSASKAYKVLGAEEESCEVG